MQEQMEKLFEEVERFNNLQKPNYAKVQQTLKQLNFFQSKLKNQITTSQDEDLKKLQILLELREKQFKQKLQVYDYCYDDETRTIIMKINDTKNTLEALYKEKVKIISVIQSIKQQSESSQKTLKLFKLGKLHQKACSVIQSKENQSIRPIHFQSKIQQSFNQWFRLINFFLTATWIINIFLANRDQSQCLSAKFSNTQMNFRIWLWVNGGVTLVVTIMFTIFNAIQSPQASINGQNNKQVEDVEDLNFVERFLLCARKFFDYTLVICIIGKFCWVFIGIVFFLNFLDFGECSDNVLNYCSLEFLTFFTFTMQITLTFLFTTLKNKALKKRFQLEQHYKWFLKNSLSEEELQKRNKGLIEYLKKSFFVAADFGDIEDLIKKATLWTLVTWIYDFVLYKKDSSPCLDETYSNFNLTFRNWLFIDGISSVVNFGAGILLTVILILKRVSIPIWQIKDQLFYINHQMLRKYCFFAVPLVLLLVFKLAWLLMGVVIFCLNLNFKQQGLQQYCSGNIPNFLIAYFTEMIYVMIESINYVVKGYKRKKKIIKQKSKSQPQPEPQNATSQSNIKRNMHQIIAL